RTGAPRLLRYDTGGDDTSVFSLGLGCSGSVEILVRSATSPEALEAARETLDLLSGDRAFSISTVLRGESAGLVRVSHSRPARGAHGESADVLVETLEPPPHLLVFGAGDDAVPLCGYASDAGFRVTLVDHRASSLSLERFPGAFRLVERRPEDGLSG